MRTKYFKAGGRPAGWLLAGVLALATSLQLTAAPSVTTIGGFTAGFKDGNTLNTALFHTPSGLAVDSANANVYVADRDNNAVRLIELGAGVTLSATQFISKPVGVALDKNNDIFVLNFGTGKNGNVVEFAPVSIGGFFLATNASSLTNVGGIALDPAGNIYVSSSNSIIKITNGVKTVVATITNPKVSLQGLVYRHSGMIAVCDSGRHGIYNVDPVAGTVTTNAGFNGAGDFQTNGLNIVPVAFAKFNQPHGIAETGDGTLLVADYGNNRCKVITTSGLVTNLYGITSKDWNNASPPGIAGWEDGTVATPDSIRPNVQADQPNGIALAPDATVYTTEDHFHIIRTVTGTSFVPPLPPIPGAPIGLNATATIGQITLNWSPSTGATNYNVKRGSGMNGPFATIFTTSGTSYVDTNVVGGVTNYYVVSALNASGESSNSAVAFAATPLQQVPTPQIGTVLFPSTSTPIAFTSVFTPQSGLVDLFNDTQIIIKGTPNTETYITVGFTNDPNAVPDPNSTNGFQRGSDYHDGLLPTNMTSYLVNAGQAAPTLIVKAIGTKSDNSPSSAVAETTFAFITGSPNIIGNNPALFYISDITLNAHLYYTLDGSIPSPTNGVDLGVAPNTTNTWQVSLQVSTNTLFQVRGFRNNYQPSTIASLILSPSNIVANTISFGFASGEASSEFVGAPGQTFYAPVTITRLPGTVMYGLEFNLTVSNVDTAPPVVPGAYEFSSMLMKPIPNTTPVLYTNIPPAEFTGSGFTNLEAINTNLNSIGLAWVERATQTNLYNTIQQTLITFSMAHDDLFPNPLNQNGVIVGGYGFQIPPTAVPGQQYQIQIGRPSGSSDGIGAPGSSVYINSPTNGALGQGSINGLKLVTVGDSLYLVGDAYPFHWFNAGDFGSGELVTNGISDVLQVFESAVYGFNTPPTKTDFFDCMDSAGDGGTVTAGGYYVDSGALSGAQLAAIYNNNDPTAINDNLFGDGKLDIADVYVTYIRSVFPTNQNYNLMWVQRFWTNGVRAALYTANPSLTINKTLKMPSGLNKSQSVSTWSPTNQPKVLFTAGDIQGTSGHTVQIPIKATVLGSYPLRVLLLNLSVVPLDGSPALTSQVTFTPISSLGPPNNNYVEQRGLGNYAAAWLNNAVTGLTGTTTIGLLNVPIPAGATTDSAYAVHFDHASASPSGFASMPEQTTSGLITLSSRTNSLYGDGIPDSWRLRYFGTIYNYLSVSNADADGDGYDNWHEYVAGTDPTDPTDHLNAAAGQVPANQPGYIQWPSVAGKQYAVQRSIALFPPNWVNVGTFTGTGETMQFNDTVAGKNYFYRVQVH